VRVGGRAKKLREKAHRKDRPVQRTGLLFERWAEAVGADALRLSMLRTGLNQRAASARAAGSLETRCTNHGAGAVRRPTRARLRQITCG
jgi:hypothetical protein